MQECCTIPSNIITKQEKPDTVSKRCQVCNSKSIEITLDPGNLGVGFPEIQKE